MFPEHFKKSDFVFLPNVQQMFNKSEIFVIYIHIITGSMHRFSQNAENRSLRCVNINVYYSPEHRDVDLKMPL